MEIEDVLHEALGALEWLATVELEQLPGEDLDGLVTGLLALRPRLDAATYRALDRWDALGQWAGTGARDAAARLAVEGRCSRKTATAMLRRARSLRSMPATVIAFGSGRITVDHVDLLAAANSPARTMLFTRDEATLVEQCEQLRHRQAARVVAYWKQRADAETGADGTPPDHRSRRLDVKAGVDGEITVTGVLDPVGGCELATALDRIVAELQRAGREGTKAELGADALVELARRAMAAPVGSRKPRPLITVVVGHHRFVELCELATGVIIQPGDLIPDLHDLDVEQIVFDGPLHAIGASPSRCFTGTLRRVIEVRDRHCQDLSGCDIPASECDVDHIIPASRGGPTSQDNGRLACRYHNRIHPQHAKPPRPRSPAGS